MNYTFVNLLTGSVLYEIAHKNIKQTIQNKKYKNKVSYVSEFLSRWKYANYYKYTFQDIYYVADSVLEILLSNFSFSKDVVFLLLNEKAIMQK